MRPSTAAVAPTRNENLRKCGKGPATRAGEGVSTGTGGAFGCTRGVRVRTMRALELARNQHAMGEDLDSLRGHSRAALCAHGADVAAALGNHEVVCFARRQPSGNQEEHCPLVIAAKQRLEQHGTLIEVAQ